MTIEAIIFDMDGLLVDSEPVWDRVRAKIAADAGKTWNHQDHVKVLGVSTNEWARYMLERLELTWSAEELKAEIINQMATIYKKKIPFRPHAVQAVTRAAARYPTALASGSPNQLIDIVTQSRELAGCFKVVISSDEVTAGKPDPAIYIETARRLGVPPEKCVCVEDSANGVLAGHRARMFVINVPDPEFPLSPDERKSANLVLESLGNLTEQALASLR